MSKIDDFTMWSALAYGRFDGLVRRFGDHEDFDLYLRNFFKKIKPSMERYKNHPGMSSFDEAIKTRIMEADVSRCAFCGSFVVDNLSEIVPCEVCWAPVCSKCASRGDVCPLCRSDHAEDAS